MVLDRNSKYIYIYLTKEYKNNNPLNDNEIGIGQTNDPMRRYKEHNDSSKSTVETRFVFFWKVNRIHDKEDVHIHKILENYGYKRIAKEVFGNSDKNKLTIETIYKIIQNQIVDGPWKIVNNKIERTTLQSRFSFKPNNPKDFEDCLNSLKLNTHLITYDSLHQEYKNYLPIKHLFYEKSILKFQDLNKIENKYIPIIKTAILKNDIKPEYFLIINNFYDIDENYQRIQTNPIKTKINLLGHFIKANHKLEIKNKKLLFPLMKESDGLFEYLLKNKIILINDLTDELKNHIVAINYSSQIEKIRLQQERIRLQEEKNRQIAREKHEKYKQLKDKINYIKSLKNRTDIEEFCAKLDFYELFDYDRTFMLYCIENKICEYQQLKDEYKNLNIIDNTFILKCLENGIIKFEHLNQKHKNEDVINKYFASLKFNINKISKNISKKKSTENNKDEKKLIINFSIALIIYIFISSMIFFNVWTIQQVLSVIFLVIYFIIIIFFNSIFDQKI